MPGLELWLYAVCHGLLFSMACHEISDEPPPLPSFKTDATCVPEICPVTRYVHYKINNKLQVIFYKFYYNVEFWQFSVISKVHVILTDVKHSIKLWPDLFKSFETSWDGAFNNLCLHFLCSFCLLWSVMLVWEERKW